MQQAASRVSMLTQVVRIELRETSKLRFSHMHCAQVCFVVYTSDSIIKIQRYKMFFVFLGNNMFVAVTPQL